MPCRRWEGANHFTGGHIERSDALKRTRRPQHADKPGSFERLISSSICRFTAFGVSP
jgi:hypothetical protein